MKNLLNIYGVLIAVIVASSCTDQSTFNNPAIHQLENGAFVRFENDGAINLDYPDPQALNIEENVYDANNNISSFTISVEANIGGALKYVDDLITITSFPSKIKITSQSLADAIGIDVSEFAFGDTFNFRGVATRNDGTIFYSESPDYDVSTNSHSRGNTHSNLTSVSAYTNAMKFGFVFFTDCPPVSGDYVIDMADSYGDGWQGPGILVTMDDVEYNIVLCSDYASNAADQEGCVGSGASGSYTLNVPDGTQSWSWNWTTDSYPSEVSFTVTDPNGVVIFSAANPKDDAMLPVINCL
jgi:hypothetical protein